MNGRWIEAASLKTARTKLEPLAPAHASEMVSVLADPALYKYTGGTALTLRQLVERYSRQASGRSPDGQHGWLNWVIRRCDSGDLVGFTQATLSREGGKLTASLAWVVSPLHQGVGFATEAAQATSNWLCSRGVHRLIACIHPSNRASIGVAENLGMHVTDLVVDGEVCWELAANPRLA